VPHLATQAHQEAIDRIVDEALQRAGVQPKQLTAVAVTVGPGLGLCLRVGALKV
jgi:N6-L-threonylcarbamoyladenine synthase